MARQCYLTTLIPRKLDKEGPTINQVEDLEPRHNPNEFIDKSCSPVGETEDIEVILGHSDKTTKVGKHLQDKVKKEITSLIREFSNIFAWSAKDMPGIPETIARHSLHVKPGSRPVCQKKQVFSEEKWQAINEEIDRLLDAGFIEPVKFSTWIENVVLVKKSNGKW